MVGEKKIEKSFLTSLSSKERDPIPVSSVKYFSLAPLKNHRVPGYGVGFIHDLENPNAKGHYLIIPSSKIEEQECFQTALFLPDVNAWGVVKIMGLINPEVIIALIEILTEKKAHEITERIKKDEGHEDFRYFELQI